MSIDYGSELAFGFVFDLNDVDHVFGKDLERKVELEDRWDPRTGEKVDPEEVVLRKEGHYIVYKGEEYDLGGSEIWEMIEALAEDVGAEAHLDGSWISGEINFFVIQPYGLDLDALSRLDQAEVEKARDALYSLERRLRDEGLEISGPGSFHSVGVIS